MIKFVTFFIFFQLIIYTWSSQKDLEYLLRNVETIDTTDISVGPLVIFKPSVFGLISGENNEGHQRPVIAAGTFENSRYVAFGHTKYLGLFPNSSDTNQLLLNSITWAAKKESGISIALYTTANYNQFTNILDNWAIDYSIVNADSLKNEQFMDSFDILCITFFPELSIQSVHDIERFLAAGGKGILGTSTGWSFGQGNLPLREIYHGGNEIFGKPGISWGREIVRGQNGQNYFNASTENLMYTNLHYTLQLFIENFVDNPLPPDVLEKVIQTIEYDLPTVPNNEIENNNIYHYLADLIVIFQTIPSESNGIENKNEQKYLSMFSSLMTALPSDKIKIHPSSSIFPGHAENVSQSSENSQHFINLKIPGKSNQLQELQYDKIYFDEFDFKNSTEIEIELRPDQWFSTGIFALAGQTIEVEIISEIPENAKVFVQIGSHSDNLARSSRTVWYRSPSIIMQKSIEKISKIKSSFGGLIYILSSYKDGPITLNLKIIGGAKAPYFKHGETLLSDWVNEIRFLPVPWTEFASEKVIITAPSNLAREILNPDKLMELWDNIMDGISDLLSKPRERERPERIVSDVQISAGHMHSGYPIMTHLDVAETSISYEKLLNGSWGHFHELGHNHQNQMWTFSGTGEVTCNIFAMYIYNEILGIPSHKAHPAISKEEMLKNLLDYLKPENENPFELWKSSPFLALLTYYQLERHFGWEFYKNVFQEYNLLVPEERPVTDQDKINTWCGLVSKVTGQQMTPFFTSWGFPLTDCDPHIEPLPPTEYTILNLFEIIEQIQ